MVNLPPRRALRYVERAGRRSRKFGSGVLRPARLVPPAAPVLPLRECVLKVFVLQRRDGIAVGSEQVVEEVGVERQFTATGRVFAFLMAGQWVKA